MRKMRDVIRIISRGLLAGAACVVSFGGRAQAAPTMQVSVDWSKAVAVSKTVLTLQVVVNPLLRPESPIHDGAFGALKELDADYVRFAPWFPYPRLAVAELEPPRAGRTSWDFSLIDPPTRDFLQATQGHPVIFNFSTLPAWMFKTDKPVTYPADPDRVSWSYTQGTELVDPTGVQAGEYFARVVSWYTQGGFKDENGTYHRSGYHYDLPWWEVLNEPDFEHRLTPEQYTRRYDAIVAAIRKVSPRTKFVGLALANPDAGMFEYFLDPRNHRAGTPLDMISYHFYAIPTPTESLEQWQYSFFWQADRFVTTVGFIERIRQRLSPATRTTIDEVGTILPQDTASPTPAAIPAAYWNLSGATYAYLYMRLAALGIDVLGESQLVGYPTQFPDVSMMDWTNGKPNARYWVLKLLKSTLGPGDTLVDTVFTDAAARVESMESMLPAVAAQAYRSPGGQRKLLLVNKRDRTVQIALPADTAGGRVETVDMATAENPARAALLAGPILELAPFAVAVVTWR
jgi:hypothetical protein